MSKPASYYRGAIERLRIARGNKCEWCGLSQSKAKLRYPNGLEFAHRHTTTVNGRGRGLPQRYHDIKNNPGAYELLCRECHLAQEAANEGRTPLPIGVPF